MKEYKKYLNEAFNRQEVDPEEVNAHFEEYAEEIDGLIETIKILTQSLYDILKERDTNKIHIIAQTSLKATGQPDSLNKPVEKYPDLPF